MYHPKQTKAYQNLAAFYYKRGQFEEAERIYKRLITVSDDLEHRRNHVSFDIPKY